MESLLKEKIKVNAIFEEGGRMRPIHFVWRGKKYTVLKVNYLWHTREGRTLYKHFSVFDGVNHFHLTNKGYARFEALYVIDGVVQLYGNKVPLDPEPDGGPWSDGRMVYEVVEPFEHIRIGLDWRAFGFDLDFKGRFSAFDYGDSVRGDPLKKATKYHIGHYQQAMDCRGSFEIRGGPAKGETREMDASEATIAGGPGKPPGRPVLILEGRRHVNLLEPVISIGRALDNDLILEDPRVSRHHAQLRQRYGRYVLYDLDSAGGTSINGYPVEECVLHCGDVVSFAGVSVIYGEDPPTPIPPSVAEKENTPAVPSPPGDAAAD